MYGSENREAPFWGERGFFLHVVFISRGREISNALVWERCIVIIYSHMCKLMYRDVWLLHVLGVCRHFRFFPKFLQVVCLLGQQLNLSQIYLHDFAVDDMSRLWSLPSQRSTDKRMHTACPSISLFVTSASLSIPMILLRYMESKCLLHLRNCLSTSSRMTFNAKRKKVLFCLDYMQSTRTSSPLLSSREAGVSVYLHSIRTLPFPRWRPSDPRS